MNSPLSLPSSMGSWTLKGLSTEGIGNRIAQSFYTIPNTIWILAGAAASPVESIAGAINFCGSLTRAAFPNSPTNFGVKTGAAAGFVSLAVATSPGVIAAGRELGSALVQTLNGNPWKLGEAALNFTTAIAPDVTIGLAQYLDFNGGRFAGKFAAHANRSLRWFMTRTSSIGGVIRGFSRLFPLYANVSGLMASGAAAKLVALDPAGFVATGGTSNLVGLAIYGSLLAADILYARYAMPRIEAQAQTTTPKTVQPAQSSAFIAQGFAAQKRSQIKPVRMENKKPRRNGRNADRTIGAITTFRKENYQTPDTHISQRILAVNIRMRPARLGLA